MTELGIEEPAATAAPAPPQVNKEKSVAVFGLGRDIPSESVLSRFVVVEIDLSQQCCMRSFLSYERAEVIPQCKHCDLDCLVFTTL